ncbi:PREDICTED: protein msta, isoform A [Ceratosolen solmsi marchali]|uniref:Protein msta, isoform A n=1 Tax=Ceratosolen solmsi marchali TaxID=326594 RepID=A0AAJ7DXK5_9HYME|nr:PREDICTED: protein msta, isoform A [Ceratosolen solmsi marchali]
MSSMKVCALCHIPAAHRCAGCRSIFYCGRDHQKAHWRTHAASCRPYKLMENSILGRHYVALRRIKVGEIVIKEDVPLLEAPQQDTLAVCLGCYAILTCETAKPCDSCGWPLCLSCKKHGPECEFTSRYKDSKVSIMDFGVTHPTYKCIGAVRALSLRDNHPRDYERLINLASEIEEAIYEEAQLIAQFIKRFFNKLVDIPESDIAKIIGIMQINGHEIPTTEPSHVAVYDLSSYLEHSCKANCSKSFTNAGGIIIRAATTIEKDDHISICYTDPLWGTVNRRHHLLRTKFFECTCLRCSDPSEFGTMFNAIKCTNGNCSGYMLPETFLTMMVPDYKCNQCENALPSDSVDEMIELMGKDLTSMMKNDMATCQAFIKRHASKIHHNHFYMTDVKLALAQLIGQPSFGLLGLGDELIHEKILLCKKLDALLTSIVPAENRIRGLIFFELHAAIAEFGRRQDSNQLFDILQESKKFLNDAYYLLKYEPDILPEGKIAKIARKNLHNMEQIIQKLYRNTVVPL